jgi:hypothetical protein
MVNDSIKAKGTLQLVLIDENGNIKQQDEHNLVVSAGLAYIASRMRDATAGVMSHMAVGTGTTAAAGAQTALVTQLSNRVSLDSTTLVTTTVANDTVQYVATFGAGVSTGAITEAGIFNASTSGTMLCRTVFAVINKGALDTLVITWRVAVA